MMAPAACMGGGGAAGLLRWRDRGWEASTDRAGTGRGGGAFVKKYWYLLLN